MGLVVTYSVERRDIPLDQDFEQQMRKETSMSEKKKKGRVKVGKLSPEEKDLAAGQAATIKGGGGNGGVNGGDVRSRDLTTATR